MRSASRIASTAWWALHPRTRGFTALFRPKAERARMKIRLENRH
jgi:hypothetical protein